MCSASSAAGCFRLEETGTLLAALATAEQELADGDFVFEPGDEDVHTAVERRVTEIAGEVGGRLHTGRSRNDQVATDMRLFTKRALAEICRGVVSASGSPSPACGRSRRCLPARVHPSPACPAGAVGSPPSRPRLGIVQGRRPNGRKPAPPRRFAARGRRPGRVFAPARP